MGCRHPRDFSRAPLGRPWFHAPGNAERVRASVLRLPEVTEGGVSFDLVGGLSTPRGLVWDGDQTVFVADEAEMREESPRVLWEGTWYFFADRSEFGDAEI